MGLGLTHIVFLHVSKKARDDVTRFLVSSLRRVWFPLSLALEQAQLTRRNTHQSVHSSIHPPRDFPYIRLRQFADIPEDALAWLCSDSDFDSTSDNPLPHKEGSFSVRNQFGEIDMDDYFINFSRVFLFDNFLCCRLIAQESKCDMMNVSHGNVTGGYVPFPQIQSYYLYEGESMGVFIAKTGGGKQVMKTKYCIETPRTFDPVYQKGE